MGLLNALQTSVSGMNAQSSYLNGVGDNIANASTTGYKQATVDFETILGQQSPGSYVSGGVSTVSSYDVTGQGTLSATSSTTDLAIQGQGFFAVTKGGTGAELLTRAGSFSPDTNGNLVNTAGYTLMGYAINPATGATSGSLVPINVSTSTPIAASATTSGTLTGNLPTSAENAGSSFSSNAFTIYDSLGNAVPLTANYTNNGSGNWTMTVTDSSGTALATQSLTFSTTTGSLSSGSPLSIPASALSADGSFTSPVSINLSGLTQLAAQFSNTSTFNGSAASTLASVKIGTDGLVTGVFADSATQALYKIPVATVESPNNLTSLNGEVYQQSGTSGTINYFTPGTGAAGTVQSGELEGSTVDLATQLTDMIVAQSSYEANSKVLQTVAQLLSKLNQIQT